MLINRELVKWLNDHIMEYQAITRKKWVSYPVMWENCRENFKKQKVCNMMPLHKNDKKWDDISVCLYMPKEEWWEPKEPRTGRGGRGGGRSGIEKDIPLCSVYIFWFLNHVNVLPSQKNWIKYIYLKSLMTQYNSKDAESPWFFSRMVIS